MRNVLLVVLTILVLLASSAINAGNEDQFYASSERFGYTGTVSVYDTWADAIKGKNARCSEFAWPQRDGAIFVVKNVPSYYGDFNSLLTNWFADNGGSPSNTNEGFIQLYDLDTDAWQNQKGFWSKDLNTFTVQAKGRNATYPSGADPEDYARLWNACSTPGSGEATRGTFLRYEYLLMATGLNGVEDESGFVTNTTNASDYNGYFRGIFLNESINYPESNGYYVFDIWFNNTSWAAENDCGYLGPNDCGGPAWDDEFGARIVNNKGKKK